jgi:hypothetical protein
MSLLGTLLFVVALSSFWSRDDVAARRRSGFDERSVIGSFGSVGRAGAAAAVSVGVAEFDGRSNVTRVVRINANAEDGGRVLIDVASTGSYSVEEDGTGVITFLNLRKASGTGRRSLSTTRMRAEREPSSA